MDKSHRETEEQCHLKQEKSMERTGSQELGEIFFPALFGYPGITKEYAGSLGFK